MNNHLDDSIGSYIETFKSVEVDVHNFASHVANHSEPTFVLIYRPDATENQYIKECLMKFFVTFSTLRMMSASPSAPIGELYFACRHYCSIPKAGQPSLAQKLKLTNADLPCIVVFHEKKVLGFLHVDGDYKEADNSGLLDEVFKAYINAGLIKLSPMMDSDLDDENLSYYREFIREQKMWVICAIVDAEPMYAFTIGLYHLYKHPEICVAADNIEAVGCLLNHMGNLVKEGKRFLSGQAYTIILENGFTVKFGFKEMNIDKITSYLGTAIGFYHTANFPVLMAFIADDNGLFPWQTGCESNVIQMQLPFIPYETAIPLTATQVQKKKLHESVNNPVREQPIIGTTNVPPPLPPTNQAVPQILKQWFYTFNNLPDPKGPVESSFIIEALRDGILTRDTMVWCEGMNDWQPVKDTPLGATVSQLGQTNSPSTPTVRKSIQIKDRKSNVISTIYAETLSGADLSHIDLSNAFFKEEDFTSTNFQCCQLKGAWFEGCSFNLSSFSEAELEYARFKHCSFKSADFTRGKLFESRFDKCNLEDCVFDKADCRVIDFIESKFLNVSFQSANIGTQGFGGRLDCMRTTLLNCNFTSAIMKNANLNSSRFISCNMTNVDLRGASIIGTTFENCNMNGCNTKGSTSY